MAASSDVQGFTMLKRPVFTARRSRAAITSSRSMSTLSSLGSRGSALIVPTSFSALRAAAGSAGSRSSGSASSRCSVVISYAALADPRGWKTRTQLQPACLAAKSACSASRASRGGSWMMDAS